MINDVFQGIREALLEHLQRVTSYSPTEAMRELVMFPGADKIEAVDFKLGAVTMLLVNIEEDRRGRPADPYRRTVGDGTSVAVNAPIPLNLYILFVARFNDYLESLKYTGLITLFFQAHRIINRENLPNLSERIDSLTTELITTPITEDNHVWRLLNAAYHPSLLYRVKMLVVQDPHGTPLPQTRSMQVETNQ